MSDLHARTLAAVALLLLALPGRAQSPQAAAEGLADVLARLDQRPTPSLALNAELEALLRDQPALVAGVPALLRPGQLRSATADVLIHVLEVIGSAEAQRALSGILGDPAQAHLDRLRAVIALGAVAEPGAEGLAALWQASAARHDPRSVDLANTALLALGVAGSTLRQQAPSRYPPLREELLGRLYGTGDPLERTLLLKAVGNLQDATLGVEVLAFLADGSAPVRASAAQSLGLMRSEAAVPVLAARLGLEASGPVRLALVASLRRLPPGSVALAAVHEQLRVEPDPAARAAMVRYLGEHLALVPEARPTLEILLHGDRARQVRLLAAAALHS